MEVRRALESDCGGIAVLHAARRKIPLAKARAWAERAVSGPGLCLIARNRSDTVAYARAGHFEPPPDARDDCAPPGWYLFGVVVHPDHRRRGIAHRLTAERLAWIAQRADKAWYFADADNTASLALHGPFGFLEVTRAFSFPGCNFERAGGILLAVDLSAGGAPWSTRGS